MVSWLPTMTDLRGGSALSQYVATVFLTSSCLTGWRADATMVLLTAEDGMVPG